ncbi:MAG: CvpA family protein [Bacteroidia bacterium]|nr:CvpA family protein [Bacteroidia bacterium]
MGPGYTINPLDILIAAVIGFGAYRGAMQGVIKRGATLVTIAAALFVSLRYRSITRNILLDNLRLNLQAEMVEVVSFAVTFVVTFVVVNTAISYIIQGLSKFNMSFDKALGALLGGFVATLALSVLFYVLRMVVTFPSPENEKGSVLYPVVRDFVGTTVSMGTGVLREANSTINTVNSGGGQQAPQAPPGQPAPEKPKVIR